MNIYNTPYGGQATAAPAANTIATATLAAPGVGKRWNVQVAEGSIGGASVTAGVLMTLKEGSTVKKNWYVTSSCMVTSRPNIMMADNQSATVELAAAGVGALGAVNISAILVETSIA